MSTTDTPPKVSSALTLRKATGTRLSVESAFVVSCAIDGRGKAAMAEKSIY